MAPPRRSRRRRSPRAPSEEVRRLGEALKGRVEVLARTISVTTRPEHELEKVFQDSLERIGRGSTIAVARWMSGEGKALAIETFAEGIEQPHELSLLREQACDSGQGFLFAHPLDADEADAFLHEWADGAPSQVADAARPSFTADPGRR